MGKGTINYVTENGVNVLHGQTTNSSGFIIAPNVSITEDSEFTLECDWMATNYWNGGGFNFGNTRVIGFWMYSSPNCLINYKIQQNTYFHVKIKYYNKTIELYINNSLVGTATNIYDGQFGFSFYGDRDNFHYYVKNLKIIM